MRKFYDYDQIKAAANCTQVARELGLTVSRENRCAATWRGGTNPNSVSINERGWHDFGAEESGSVIDLVARVHYGGGDPISIMRAQEWLGERLGLAPTHHTKPSPHQTETRYDKLIAEGYTETKRYDYTDAEGQLVQQVIRLEHPSKPKQFLQCAPDGRWSVKHINPVLYNLPAITPSSWVVVVEGEKDADTLIEWGIPATTNAGGAKKWDETFSATLSEKTVYLIPDNDEAGKHHLDIVGKSIQGKAKAIYTLTPSTLPKGDVTDWRDKEGGTREKFQHLLETASEWVEPHSDDMALRAAKAANQKPLCNFEVRKLELPNGKTRTEREPRALNALVDDIHLRFLAFPRKVGTTLFDHDRDTGEIRELHTPAQLFAWMAHKAKGVIDWRRGDAMVPREDIFAGLANAAQRYESISNVPDYPRRDDVYYTHPPLPEPTPDHSAFNGLIDFFSPAGPENRALLKTLFCAPIFYRPGIPRPLWVIDSYDGAGTGKTTLAEMVAELYGHPPIHARQQSLSKGMDELIKRMISAGGRAARVLLLDNITGEFHSEELASLVTQAHITGRTPYGRGEETRPNNLTYILTANSASLDNDLITRGMFIYLKRADISGTWRSRVAEYVRVHRLSIFADILHILSNYRAPDHFKPVTRFPEFESTILLPNSDGKYHQVIEWLSTARDMANTENDLAKAVVDALKSNMEDAGIQDSHEHAVFIESPVLGEWLKPLFPKRGQRRIVSEVRNFGKNELIKEIDSKITQWPHNGDNRRSGVLWVPKSTSFVSYSVRLNMALRKVEVTCYAQNAPHT